MKKNLKIRLRKRLAPTKLTQDQIFKSLGPVQLCLTFLAPAKYPIPHLRLTDPPHPARPYHSTQEIHYMREGGSTLSHLGTPKTNI